jgi:hypothetical protein
MEETNVRVKIVFFVARLLNVPIKRAETEFGCKWADGREYKYTKRWY